MVKPNNRFKTIMKSKIISVSDLKNFKRLSFIKPALLLENLLLEMARIG